MAKIVYGADSETLHGEPLSLQFYSEDVPHESLYFVNAQTAFRTFVAWIKKRQRHTQHVVYVHHLAFDLVEFLWGHHPKLVSAGGDFDFNVHGLHFVGVYGAPTFLRVTNGKDLTVTFVDSFSWFRESLDAASVRVCPTLRKLPRPAELGEKKFTARDTKFCEYAMRDAVVAYHLGRAIEAVHVQWDLRQCVSVADMSATIFRHQFLDYCIPQPNIDVIEAAMASYHGGKNNITARSGWYSGVTALDISSAFPHAMSLMPAFAQAKLYKRFRAAKRVQSVPPYGVYRVRGVVDACAWPVLFSHEFKKLEGDIHDVWVQGFELNEALESEEFHPRRVEGFYYDAERDNQAPALRTFCETFYELKERESNKVVRYLLKLILNALYGKFIQTRKRGSSEYTDVDAGTTTTAADLVAGGMFHPFIASATTGQPRARIHRLEHHYEALHTATDGVLTQRSVVRRHGVGDFDLSPSHETKLGSVTVEARDADLMLVRNKCYVLYARKSEDTTPSKVFVGKHILKYAKHGFQGSVTELEKMMASGRRKYSITRPNTLKESLKRKLVPNKFERHEFTLKVPPLAPR